MIFVLAFGFVLTVAASPALRAQEHVDSLVLERTLCYGTCPAYRLSIRANGAVRFQSRNPGDTTSASDSLSPNVLIDLAKRATAIRLAAYPERVREDRAMCEDFASDHPTVTVALFAAPRLVRIVDYQGCFHSADHSLNVPLTALRTFERSIDSALGSARWVRPAQRR
jgi:hypothetical protein